MKMNGRLLTTFFALGLAMSFGQGPQAGGGGGFGQGQGNGQRNGNGTGQPGVDVNQQVVVEGEVTLVNIGFGVRYPSIEINGTQIKIAPVWFLLEYDFEIQEKDWLSVIAAPSTATADAYLHALSIRNDTTGKEITLRDVAGTPLWIRARGQMGNREPLGAGAMNGGCVDPATIDVITGIVDQVTIGAGIRQPTLVINVSGQLVNVKIGPARLLLANDFELNAGEQVTAKVATAARTNELVALELTNKDGKTVTLRNDDGAPAW